MKNLLFIIPALFIVAFTSCKKEEIAPTVVKTDLPPVEMFGENDVPYVVSTVYITEQDVMDAFYVDNITISYPVMDQFGNIISYSNNSQDWYTLMVPKYWGVYKNQTYISSSIDVYSISGQTLSRVREMIKRRGGDCVAQFYISENEPTGARQQIVWVQQN